LGYKIFMNDGDDGELDTQVIGMSSRAPNINSFVIDMSAGTIGKIYKFKVRAENINDDYVETNALSVALASLPSKPLSAPTSDSTITNMHTLGVNIELFSSVDLNGGSEIHLYEI